jgi:hypothetical protein
MNRGVNYYLINFQGITVTCNVWKHIDHAHKEKRRFKPFEKVSWFCKEMSKKLNTTSLKTHNIKKALK